MVENALIISMSRSGGTLLNNLCDSHEELNVIPFEYWNLCNKNQIKELYYRFFRFLPTDVRMREVGFHQRLMDIVDEVHGRGSYRRLYELISGRIRDARTIPEFYDLFQEVYFPEFCGHEMRGKTVNHPANLSLRDPDYIRRIYGDIRLIVTVRDPRSSFISYTLNRERNRGYGHDANQTMAYCEQWSGVFDRYVNSQSSAPILWLRFEDVLHDTEKSMQSVANFLGVTFQSSMLTPTRLGMPIESNSSFEKTQALTSAPAERWREHLDPERREIIENLLGPKMIELGYSV
jgi:hypothetical protein